MAKQNATDRIVTREELNRMLWGAADILRGTVDAGDFKNHILALMFLKRLSDVFKERRQEIIDQWMQDGKTRQQAEKISEDPDEYTSGSYYIPEGARWDDLLKVGENRAEAVDKALHSIEGALFETEIGAQPHGLRICACRSYVSSISGPLPPPTRQRGSTIASGDHGERIPRRDVPRRSRARRRGRDCNIDVAVIEAEAEAHGFPVHRLDHRPHCSDPLAHRIGERYSRPVGHRPRPGRCCRDCLLSA